MPYVSKQHGKRIYVAAFITVSNFSNIYIIQVKSASF